MARHEANREDLIREATALVERIELAPVQAGRMSGTVGAIAGSDDRIVAGFRASGALSIFFGGDPVYQFNAAGELRRAYVGDRLYKAVRGRLVSLERRRLTHAVELYSRELSESEQATLVERMQAQLCQLQAEIEAGGRRMTGQVPPDADILGRLRQWLATHGGAQIAQSPRV